MTENIQEKPKKGLLQLKFLNLFMADVQAGIGPFLGVFLLAHQWDSGLIGTVLSIAGIFGMLVTTPAGALIDLSKNKRLYVIIPAIFTIIASGLILISQNFWLVTASQIATAVAGAAIGPAVIGITLGIVKQKGFNRQNGINQAYNHAGNMIAAGLSGFLGWKFGMPAIFILAAVFGVLTIITTFAIPADSIDYNASRGLKEGEEHRNDKASGFKVLFETKALIILAVCLAFFHLGNGAMLPLYGLANAAKNNNDPSLFVALTIVIAQATMIITSIIAMRSGAVKGYYLVMLISFLSLPIRGYIASRFVSSFGIYPVQILDGIGAGLQSVAVPALVAKILNGTGRINVGQGAVMTVQGIGAALSPAIGGWIAQKMDYGSAFLILGSFATVSIVVWMVFASSLKKCC